VPLDDGSCSGLTRRCADARDYRHELRPCCKGHLREMMASVSMVLGDLGVTWWADYGTLLGAVRNPLTRWSDYPWLPQGERAHERVPAGVVPHDKDADLGLLFADWPMVQRRLRGLAGRGYNVHVNQRRASTKVRLSARNHTNVDLFFWRERGDGTLYREFYAAVDAYKGREFPRSMVERLSAVEWEGLTLPAPADPRAFLEMRYGPRWMTPVAANNDGVRR